MFVKRSVRNYQIIRHTETQNIAHASEFNISTSRATVCAVPCITATALPLLFVATATAARCRRRAQSPPLSHSMCIAFWVRHSFNVFYCTLPTTSIRGRWMWIKIIKNKKKTSNQSGAIRVFARIEWLMSIVTGMSSRSCITTMESKKQIQLGMKLRCEIIQISFPFVQAPPFIVTNKDEKIWIMRARVHKATQRIKINRMNYSRMWADWRTMTVLVNKPRRPECTQLISDKTGTDGIAGQKCQRFGLTRISNLFVRVRRSYTVLVD